MVNIDMFIKVTKSGQYEYAYLVRSYQEYHNTKHKYLFNLGRMDQIEVCKFQPKSTPYFTPKVHHYL
jgi:hypothetical protein